ncbi:hypothetical protein M2152_002597 [Microbacteriaceae bacterium SG_E_30_P1]|uniref:Gram-positive cocci surface proteins LPxTG domain-containing protein n=1 Tax=Antiquaquibacter oligotrophicus TaxID=2880260 RepID=A0ABT6KR07_9MICO|nr:SGNH/GDSL hydrolase family protein [Antiquaquibacter oligotrophicus]MDH6182415.1 hypothetical protein [Antiquaquibacter oligotrophicus]UDF14613.1 SGNH/GDSL hydrolase family protein [Antiquaquibacter oligotrophicus]
MRIAAASLAIVVALGAGVTAASAASPGELDGLEYVALGDSYSAGFGLTPYSSTSPFAGDPNGCYQADANYPHNVASALSLDLTDQTCSGAISANLGYPSGTSFPIPVSADPLPELPATDQVQVTLSGLTAPELQNAALSADTDIVTFAIGGNDLGFANIATACIRDEVGADTHPLYLYYDVGADVENCAQYFGSGSSYLGADLFARLSGDVEPRLAATFDAIKQLAPNAQVFVVGYPQIAPANATDACFSSMSNDNAVPFSGVDLEFIHTVESALDDTLQTQAEAHGFHFVSTWSSTTDNTLCSSDPWIAGLTAYVNFESSCDDGYLPQADGYVCVKLGALHPNEEGVANLTSIASAAIHSAFHVTPSVSEAKRGDTVTVTGGGFHPGETVRLELRLGGVTLVVGSAVADASGSFTATVTIPASAAIGTHALHGVGAESGRSFSSTLSVTHVGALAATGSDAFVALGLAVALLLLGVSAAAIARRRTR